MERPGHSPQTTAARLVRFGPGAVVAAAFAAGVVVSWRAWASLIIDCGRELQVPERLLHGALLYRDVRYWYGPLGPYLNAGLYGLFGTRVEVLAGAGLAAAALTAWALLALVRGFAGAWAGAAVAVAFVGSCAFGHLLEIHIFGWPIPYAYPATYGMTAAAWSLALALDHLRGGSRAAYLASAACLAAVALTKMELLAALLLAHAVVAAALLATGRFTARLHGGALAAALALPAGVYGWFASLVGPALWSDNLGANFSSTLVVFSRFALGLDDPSGAFWSLLRSVLLLLAVASLAAWGARQAGRSPRWAALLACAAGAAGAVGGFAVEEPLRALPLVLLAGILVAALQALREPAQRAGGAAALALFTFALACLARILLRASPARYGFYLLAPGLAALGVIAFDLLPRRLAPPGPGRWPVHGAGVGLLLGVTVAAASTSAGWYATHTAEVSTSRGRLRLPANGFEASMVRRLAEFPPGTSVRAVAEGAGLVFMSGLAPAPDGMSSYLPIDLTGSHDEAAVLARWRAAPTDLVLLYRRPLPEYGSKGFGVDYGLELVAWLREHYEPFGERAGPFVLARRKQAHGP